MNHTIKSIIIVAAIASMLVLGATMIPIMQNSFASKKHDFKGAERNPNTNTNSNTNTADSSSTSDATASNTNNINNTATATQSQEQSACAIALTCSQGSTTVTVTPPTSTCNPSTLGDITATPTDGTCTATLPAGSTPAQTFAFHRDCENIPGSTGTDNPDGSFTCTFQSIPPK